MKLKLSIKRQIQLQPDVLEEKINVYLKKNFYRIIERGPGFVIFIDDEYSDRKRPRSDYHSRIGEGKFEFNAMGQETAVKLIYLTPVLYPAFLMMLLVGAGMYSKSLLPIFCSFAFYLPLLLKILNMKDKVFNEILKC
ncbi:hypothetical protein ACVW0P_002541 [Mucilaginibacter sp. UYNi724]